MKRLLKNLILIPAVIAAHVAIFALLALGIAYTQIEYRITGQFINS